MLIYAGGSHYLLDISGHVVASLTNVASLDLRKPFGGVCKALWVVSGGPLKAPLQIPLSMDIRIRWESGNGFSVDIKG